MSEQAALLTVPAIEVMPGDSIAEGTAVHSIHCHQVEVRDALGYVTQEPVIDIRSGPARIVEVFEYEPGKFLHDRDRSADDEKRFRAGEVVRVVRPGPIEPCANCGFGGQYVR